MEAIGKNDPYTGGQKEECPTYGGGQNASITDTIKDHWVHTVGLAKWQRSRHIVGTIKWEVS